MRISRRALGAGLIGAAIAPCAGAQTPSAWAVPDDAAIRKILAERIDTLGQGVGIVVGVIDAKGRRVIAHGVTARGGKRPVDGDTVFEIGSMTKVFTSLLLADMVRRGEVALDDPVAKFLPADVRAPERGGRQITLIDLATHTSGLPRMPNNFAPQDPLNPYADYDAVRLHAFLNGHTLSRDIGAQYEYSNLGAGLLGHALARRAGVGYEALVQQRVLGPLGMKDTAITLSPPLRARLATGHTGTMEPIGNWDLDALAGAGALRSTANDMLTFLAAELGYTKTPLAGAMADQLSPRRKGPAPVEIALGWHVSKLQTGEVFWHNGGTGGYRTLFAFDPRARAGIVVLTNAATPAGGDDIGFHVLAGRPLAKLEARKVRTAIVLPPGELAAFVGTYEFPAIKLEVTQESGRLFGRVTGSGRYEIFPEAPNAFFWKIVDAQVAFTRDPAGQVSGAVFRQNGVELTGRRVAQ